MKFTFANGLVIRMNYRGVRRSKVGDVCFYCLTFGLSVNRHRTSFEYLRPCISGGGPDNVTQDDFKSALYEWMTRAYEYDKCDEDFVLFSTTHGYTLMAQYYDARKYYFECGKMCYFAGRAIGSAFFAAYDELKKELFNK